MSHALSEGEPKSDSNRSTRVYNLTLYKGLSEKLQRPQNRAARTLMSASYDSNLDDLFRTLGWQRLFYQRLEQKSILMSKTLHGMTPDYLRSRFVYRDDVGAYRLRNTENKLVLPQPRTDYLKKSFSYCGAQLWINLPIDLRQASSLADFKSAQFEVIS